MQQGDARRVLNVEAYKRRGDIVQSCNLASVAAPLSRDGAAALATEA